jgi:UDP-N-acetylglucosamine enolpyruvyl transferase
MKDDLHSKVDVMCEILKRVDEKVTIQNGNVARLKEWQIQHMEQECNQVRAVEELRTKLTILEPVISTMKYPRVVMLAIVAVILLSVKGSLASAFSLFGI